jgi:hypothetical protein
LTVKLTLLLERVVDGVVELEWPPTDEEMRELGWVRAPLPEVPELVVPTNGHGGGTET